MADFGDQFIDSAGSSRAEPFRKRSFGRGGDVLGNAVRQVLHDEDFRKRLIQPVSHTEGADPLRHTSAAIADRIFNSLSTAADIDIVGVLDEAVTDQMLKIEILQSVARRFGDAWIGDESSFVGVTLAMARLQLALNRIGQDSPQLPSDLPGRVVLVVVPLREQHHFGASVVEELFRQRGWVASSHRCDDDADLEVALKSAGASVVCLAWSSGFLMREVEAALRAIQLAKKSRNTLVLAGGAAAQEKVEWLYQRGIDNVCADAYLAIEYAERHVHNQTHAKAGIASTKLPQGLSSIA